MRATLCLLFLLAVLAGCKKVETTGSGGTASAPTSLAECQHAAPNCAPCKFNSDGDTCRIDVDIVYKSQKDCSVLLETIYVATDEDGHSGKSKFGGTVALKISDANYNITDVTFNPATSTWKKPTVPSIPYTLQIASQVAPSSHKFTVTIKPVAKTEFCTTKDPVIGNGLY